MSLRLSVQCIQHSHRYITLKASLTSMPVCVSCQSKYGWERFCMSEHTNVSSQASCMHTKHLQLLLFISCLMSIFILFEFGSSHIVAASWHRISMEMPNTNVCSALPIKSDGGPLLESNVLLAPNVTSFVSQSEDKNANVDCNSLGLAQKWDFEPETWELWNIQPFHSSLQRTVIAEDKWSQAFFFLYNLPWRFHVRSQRQSYFYSSLDVNVPNLSLSAFQLNPQLAALGRELNYTGRGRKLDSKHTMGGI